MRPLVALLLAVALGLTAFPASAEGLDVVRVRKLDGTVVPGFVLEKQDEGLLVRSGAGEVFIPWAEIDEVVHIDSPVEPSEDTAPEDVGPVEPRPAPVIAPANPQDAFTQNPGWGAYTAARIRLLDKRGRFVGPSQLGYRPRDFGKDGDERFHAKKGNRYLTIPEFVELSGSSELIERYERQLDKAHDKARAGFGVLALSASLAGVGWPLTIGGGLNGDLLANFAGPGFIGWSIATTVIAASVQVSAQKRLRELRETNLDELIERPDAWPHVQSHNSTLRQETGLPDDERADSN